LSSHDIVAHKGGLDKTPVSVYNNWVNSSEKL